MTDPAIVATRPALPALYSVRGWPAEVNPAYITFVDEMRSTGVEVVDVYVGPTGFSTLGEWAGAVADEIQTRHQTSEPLHLMSYCLGGVVAQVALGTLTDRGIEADFVALIDPRHEPPQYRLERGLDSLYRVPWGFRIRHHLLLLTPPDSQAVRAVLLTVLRRAARSVMELPKRGWRSRRRVNPMIFTEMYLAHHWEFSALLTPVYLYNVESSIQNYGDGDPSVHMGRYLSGGFTVRVVEGDHENCIEPPYSTGLIKRINADRRAVVAGAGAFQ
ncbi:MAG: hypothetical protein F2837_08590 [Actinobacteria bacterium]|uniref:Unannotated protein n=1 Tax=freshwater metagenome TaxID=449393 RepID=A0A6J7JZD6_9ZZZZ|nr:hypothetical protein [Actinomycetota bacterium]